MKKFLIIILVAVVFLLAATFLIAATLRNKGIANRFFSQISPWLLEVKYSLKVERPPVVLRVARTFIAISCNKRYGGLETERCQGLIRECKYYKECLQMVEDYQQTYYPNNTSTPTPQMFLEASLWYKNLTEPKRKARIP